jgi:hypothetical protein
VEMFRHGHAKWYSKGECDGLLVAYTARPCLASGSASQDPMPMFDLYARSQGSIVAKLARAGSLSRVMEALFNKAGVSFPSKYVALIGHVLRERALTVSEGELRFDPRVAAGGVDGPLLSLPSLTAPGFHFTNMRPYSIRSNGVGSLLAAAEQVRPVLLASGGCLEEPFVEHSTLLLLARAVDGARRVAEQQ